MRTIFDEGSLYSCGRSTIPHIKRGRRDGSHTAPVRVDRLMRLLRRLLRQHFGELAFQIGHGLVVQSRKVYDDEGNGE